MLQLIKFDRKYAPQLNEMMDEWTAANEKIIPQKEEKKMDKIWDIVTFGELTPALCCLLQN